MQAMSADTRRRNLESMADAGVDVLVVGGGITGAGVALEAVMRGLRTGVVEARDFASGTSGRSSREVHGGLRYLAKGQIGLVHESLRERRRIAAMLPHLVDPLPFFVATPGWTERLALGTGLAAYDLLDDRRAAPVSGRRRIAAEEAARMTGGLLRGFSGYRFFETVTDDARLTLQVLLHAASLGALVCNYVSVEGFLGSGRTAGVLAADRLTGERTEITATAIVNATGVWAAEVLRLAGRDPLRLRPSKGVHLVFDRSRLPIRSGLVIRSVVPGAFQFMIPWGDRVYVGTTDTPYEGDYASPGVDEQDAAVILESLNRALPVSCSVHDVVGSWAGIRPLLEGSHAATADISRRHLVLVDPPGLVTVTGGKLTTFRVMARDAIQAAMRDAGIWAAPMGRVERIGLLGSLDAAMGQARERARKIGLDPAVGSRMVRRYGDGWREALHLVEDDFSLAKPLHDQLPVLRVEAVMGRQFEMAMTEEDILERRTRITTMDRRLAETVSLPEV